MRPTEWLPKVEDFVCVDPPEDDLDGFRAWQIFGGLTVDEAYQKFCECPEIYQEDFMFMADAAFAFYFPVVDRYIREKEPGYSFDEETHMLGYCIELHVGEDCPHTLPLLDRIVKLCCFVLQGLKNVTDDGQRMYPLKETEERWEELLQKTQSLM
jgi:hypothetical protein